jgi:flagellar biosynthetic protein FlhB
MADDTDEAEKTETATPRRLEKAREDGQVARSRELTTFLLLGCGLLGLWLMGSHLATRLRAVMGQAFLFDRAQAFDAKAMIGGVYQLGSNALVTVAPLFLALTVMALAAPLLLGGWLMSGKSMEPKLSKLNPLQGLKRMVSSQLLAELGKAIAKSVLVGGVGIAYLYQHRGALVALMGESVLEAFGDATRLILKSCALMVMTLALVALIDVPYQLWSHGKKLRMSKEEIKQENKETEGDPHVKGHIRAQQQALARNRMMSKVPEADVIVTNPTHYAVALRYDGERMSAPRVVAKGAGEIAAKIKELGREHRVPLLEAPPLARALYRHVDLDREIPGVLYSAVAAVLVWAMRLKRARQDGGASPPAPHDLEVPAGMDIVEPTGEEGA